MQALDPLSLLVRWAHVGGMAAILGGALLIWWLASSHQRIDAVTLLRVGERYEWIFWGAIGLQVMTGVGNLGAFGAALPPPGTGWGTRLTVKLGCVLLFAALSVPRTLTIATMAAQGEASHRRLAVLYAGTTIFAVGIAGLAVWLAHG